MKAYLAHIVFFLLLCASAQAQHTPVWSQYLTNGLALNPAIAGSRDALSINVSHRHQWVGIEGAPSTQLLSAHTPLKGDKLAVGLLLNQDVLGVSTSLGGSLNFAYRLRIKDAKLSLGMSAGAFQRHNDWDQVVTHTTGDNTFEGQAEVQLVPIASAGAYLYGKKSFVSLSAPYLINGETAITSSLHLMAIAGHRFQVGKNITVTPSALFRLNRESVYQADVNALVAWRETVELGASYRTNETVVMLLRARPNKQFALTYSYDFLLSDLGRYEGGSHEITLSYDFKFQHSLANPRFF